MFNIEFYKDKHGRCDVLEFLENLRLKSKSDKNARIQYKQMSLYIQLLQDNGINLPTTVAKHIYEDIWELRPGFNRILYFYYENNTFVLLHQFQKSTNKTPQKEINKAIKERNEYIAKRRTS